MRGLVAGLFGLFIYATLCDGQFNQILKNIITTDNVISSGDNMVHYLRKRKFIHTYTHINVYMCVA
jgi:hypothetical protein